MKLEKHTLAITDPKDITALELVITAKPAPALTGVVICKTIAALA